MFLEALMNRDDLAQIIWDYHHMNHKIVKSDLVVVLGSHDESVAKKGAELIIKGFAPFILFSGGLGKITKEIWNITEAEKFAQIAIDMGISKENIIIEKDSSNTGENVIFTRNLVEKLEIKCHRIIAVHKPYMERRTFATFKNFWPDVELLVTSPGLSMKEYLDNYPIWGISKNDILGIMLGDLKRIMIYPQKGFQIPQEVPHYVMKAYEELVESGLQIK